MSPFRACVWQWRCEACRGHRLVLTLKDCSAMHGMNGGNDQGHGVRRGSAMESIQQIAPAQPGGEVGHGQGIPTPLPAGFACHVPTRSPQRWSHSGTSFPPTQWRGRCWATPRMDACRPGPWLRCALPAPAGRLGCFTATVVWSLEKPWQEAPEGSGCERGG